MNTKEFFNNDVEVNVGEEELVLAPPTELIDEAKEIAQNTTDDEKFPFILKYDVNQKDALQSMLQMVGAVVEDDDEEGHMLSTRMNMTQLALIKRLESVERVMTNEVHNPFLMEEAKQLAEAEATQTEQVMTLAADETVEAVAEPAMANSDDGIAVACVGGTSSSCNCPTNTTMATAQTITVGGVVHTNICCPGAEQWFKFTVPQTKQYTIYTFNPTGRPKDTVGTLYDCSGNEIIEVDDYEPSGKLHFRIIQTLTAGMTYYLKVRFRGGDTGSYSLKLTERVLANFTTITPNAITLEKGVLYELPLTPNYTYKGYNGARPIPGLSVSLNPSNTSDQTIWWSSDSTGALDCFSDWDDDGDRYFHLVAREDGIEKLFASDWSSHGRQDECAVYVGGAPVTGISLDRSNKIVSLNDTEQLTATVAPYNALNKGVTWNSSNWSVVDVDSNGVITGLKVGTATISATTDDGGYIATCIVTVDERPKVMVERDEDYSFGDEDYFNITFPNGKIWRSIGCDLALDENRSGLPLWNKVDCYDSFTNPEQRYVDNIEQTFSAQELALIYRLDPLGIEYFMKTNACDNMTLAEGLFFKDDVYKAIFGEPPSNRFYFTINDSGQVLYGTYTGWNRTDVYSNAETLFGSHVIFDWSNFWQSILTTLFEAIPGVSYIQTGVEIYQALFHAGSFWGMYSSYAKSKVEEYVNEPLDDYIEDKLGEKAHKCIGWANNLISILKDATISAFVIPNLNDITIYDTIEEQDDYRVVFENYDGNLSLQEIIDLCES